MVRLYIRTMDIKDRRREILDYIAEHNYMTVEDFVSRLGVSAVTIRSDLACLEEQGELIRTHGGAMKPERKSSLRSISNTLGEFEEEKKAIAEKASSFIKDGSTILIDSGSTTIHLVKYLRGKRITVVTNNVLALERLMNEESIDVIFLGGNLRRASMGTIGPLANAALRSVNVDVCFLGAAAYNAENISSSNLIEAELKRIMMASADKVVFLADHSKCPRKAFSTVCNWDGIDTFVTDSIDPSLRKILEQKGVDVIVAK
jgi:Transcriptional regulators of sugar metabolism